MIVDSGVGTPFPQEQPQENSERAACLQKGMHKKHFFLIPVANQALSHICTESKAILENGQIKLPMVSTQNSKQEGKNRRLSVSGDSLLLSYAIKFAIVWATDRVAVANCRAGPARAKENFKRKPNCQQTESSKEGLSSTETVD